jgi:hypothetical protein
MKEKRMHQERSGATRPIQRSSAGGRGLRAAASSGLRERVASAMNTLLDGYRNETELYLHMLRLTWRQRDLLGSGLDLYRFRDLLEEKEDLLRRIGRIELEMKSAKSLVLSQPPSQCPSRWTLEMLLDRLTDTIEEIRIVESSNARLLGAVPAAS